MSTRFSDDQIVVKLTEGCKFPRKNRIPADDVNSLIVIDNQH